MECLVSGLRAVLGPASGPAPPRRVPSHPWLVLARSDSCVLTESIFGVLSRSAQSDVGVLPATN
jgi:hypothetical protein